MSITAINSVNSLNFQTKKEAVKNTVTNPILNKKPETTLNSGSALKSYFLAASTINFKGFSCSTGDFAVKKLDDVPCCCCGQKMIRGIQMPIVIDSFTEKKGTALADKIAKDKDYFRSSQKLVATLMADEARKNESLGAAGAFAKARANYPQKIQAYCVNVLNNMANVAKEAYGKEENPMSTLAHSEIEKVKKGQIDRIDFTERLEKLKGDLPLEKYEKVLDEAMNLPESEKSVSRIFNKKFKKGVSDYAVMERLLKGALSTAEHVHPHSKGGPNATSNYLGECALCNNPRGSMSYAEWLKVHPEYPIKVQTHIEYVTQKIVDGEIPETYDSYPVDINKTLTKESNGVMTLKVLNPETIQKLREDKQSGKIADVAETTDVLFDENEENNNEIKDKK